MIPKSTIVPMAIAIPDSATILASTPKYRMAIKTIKTARGNRLVISKDALTLNTIMITTKMVINISSDKASSSVPKVS